MLLGEIQGLALLLILGVGLGLLKLLKRGSHPEWENLGFAGLILTALEKGE